MSFKARPARCLARGLAPMLLAAAAWPALAEGPRPLVIARNLDLNSLDPSRASCDTCLIYLSSVYETLVRMADDQRSIEPALARSWEANDNNTRFVFHLDPRAVFADGSPVEAKDVVWSWERLANAQGGMSWLLDSIASIETPDAATVVVTLAQPDGEFLGKVMGPNAGIINSDLAEAHGARAGKDAANTDTAEPWFLARSAGSGPFALKSYTPNDELRLVRNTAYWADAPALDEIVLRQVKDAVVQAQMLQSGGADIAMQISPDLVAGLKSETITVETSPSAYYIYMAISPGAAGAPKALLDQRVRDAITLAVDYDQVLDFTLAGAGRLQPSPIPNGFPGTDGLPRPKTDLERARALLAEAGLTGGLKLRAAFPSSNFYGVDMATLMQKLQQDLGRIGVALELEPMAFPVWLDLVLSDGSPITASYYGPDYFGSAQFVKTFGMIPGTRWFKRSGANRVEGIANPREGAILDAAMAASGAEADRLYHDLALQMIGDKIIVPLVNPDSILAHAAEVKGVSYSINELLSLRKLSRGE